MAVSIDVSRIIDQPRLGRLQVLVIALCSAAAVIDGFDMLLMAFAASSIAQKLDVDVSAFGTVFGLTSFGLMIGSLAFGSVADRAGRKPMIVLAMTIIGLCSLLTPFTQSFTQLLVVRFFAGIGLGGLMPNIIALTAEYSPRQWRATVITVMFSGVSFGAILAGILSAALFGVWGWQVVFYLGGALPFLLAFAFLLFLPESLSFLIVRKASSARSLRTLRRLDPGTQYGEDVKLTLFGGQSGGGSVRLANLFSQGRAQVTPLLWLIFFCNLLVWFFLTNWLPTILQGASFSRERAALATALLYAGGLVGGLVLGWMVDKRMSYGKLGLVYLVASLCVVAVGVTAAVDSPFILPSLFAAGFFVGGAQYAINALAANFYPTQLRSTGIGWALGIGRLGSILGPGLGGVLLASGWRIDQLIGVLGLPALLAGFAATTIGLGLRRRNIKEETNVRFE